MRILIVTQYFWPENFRINDLATALKGRRHEVVVLTGKPNYPAGRFFPGYGFIERGADNFDGIPVVRVPLIPRGSGSGFRLAINYLSFALFASLIAPFRCRGNFDLIFVYEVSPVTVALPALVLKLLRGSPVLLWVLDLWPESLSAAGAIRSRFVIRAVSWLVKRIYRHSDRILVQSRAFEPSVVRMGVAARKIVYFPNWAEPIFDGVRQADLAPPMPLPAGFRIMYAGNVGAAQDFPNVLAAAEQLRSHSDIQWIILGDGRLRDWVRQEIEHRGLERTVHLFGNHPLSTMPAWFMQADVMLVCLKRDPIFALTIPGKLQSYLACGRPVVGMLDGEGARIIRESGAGLVCDAEEPAALAERVLELYAMPKVGREQMGMRGRLYYEAHFARDQLLDRLEQLMSTPDETRWLP
ncbi:MAG: glycosyltransferase family 4 protein [Betaproteobacteria bacterium]|nr:glycosyltransferase family 4 protein [Betaproteobacteria bacterium]